MDIADKAVELQNLLNQNAIKNRTQTMTVQSAEYCIDCDEPIPKARQLAIIGVQRCVACQEQQEHRQKVGYY